ncbi:MAG: S49 family peptidase, partial [Alphaproteobacteria bacterium]
MSELKRRKEDRFPRRIFGIFQRIFFVIGIAATISIGMLTFTLLQLARYQPPAMPAKILLTYTFKPGLTEVEGRPSLSQPLLRPATTFREVVFALENAAKDPRVQGFIGKLQDIDFSVAQVQELRDAIAGFRKAGKFAWIYSESYGGFSPGMSDYYLASSFDQIWLQPVGVVAVHGVAAEVPFARETLDKLGIEAQFAHKGKYKSAAESLTHTGMTPENREATESLVHDLYDQMTTGIAADRKMTVAELSNLIDTAPHSDEEAFKAKLVDRLDYYDVMVDDARKKAGLDKEDTVELLGYSFISETTDLKRGVNGFVSKFMWKESPSGTHKNKDKIALIYGAGEIVPYKKSQGTFGEGGMKAEKIVEAFSEALEDEYVAAIVFRIDSPGGSPSASETIRRAIKAARAKGKPVIVSMGSYAASGGYWIATGADKIVAQPATITGSIGVFGGKLVIAGLLEKLG